jgi:hypothetical protein
MMSLRRTLSSRQALIVWTAVITLAIALSFLIYLLVAAADEALNVRTRYDGTYGMVSDGIGGESELPTLLILGVTSAVVVFLARFLRKRLTS